MYIRRKVFSVLEDAFGEERYFSTTDLDYGFGYRESLFSDDEAAALGGMGAAAALAGAGIAGGVRAIDRKRALGIDIAELKRQSNKAGISADKKSALEDKIERLKEKQEKWAEEGSLRNKIYEKSKSIRDWARKNAAGVNGLSGDLQDQYLELLKAKDKLNVKKALNKTAADQLKKNKKDADKAIKEFLKEHKEGLSKGSGRAKLAGVGLGVLGAGAAAGYGLNQL